MRRDSKGNSEDTNSTKDTEKEKTQDWKTRDQNDKDQTGTILLGISELSSAWSQIILS